MNSMMHRRLTTIVHMIVLRALVLVLMTRKSLVHSRTRMVAMLFRPPHVVILSSMRHGWRLTWVLRLIRVFLDYSVLDTLHAILTAATNGNRYARRNCHLWLLLLLWKTRGRSSADRFHSRLGRKGMVLLVMKVSSRSPLLLLHVHVIHSVLFSTSHTLLNRISPMWSHQPLLLVVVVIIVWRHVGMIDPLLLWMHTSHHGLSVSNMVRLWMMGVLPVELRGMLHVMIVSSHWMVMRSWMMNHARRTERIHRRCIRSRRWRPL